MCPSIIKKMLSSYKRQEDNKIQERLLFLGGIVKHGKIHLKAKITLFKIKGIMIPASDISIII